MRGLPDIRDATRLYDVYSFRRVRPFPFLPPPRPRAILTGNLVSRSLTFIKRPRPPRMRTRLNSRNCASNSCGSSSAVKPRHGFVKRFSFHSFVAQFEELLGELSRLSSTCYISCAISKWYMSEIIIHQKHLVILNVRNVVKNKLTLDLKSIVSNIVKESFLSILKT